MSKEGLGEQNKKGGGTTVFPALDKDEIALEKAYKAILPVIRNGNVLHKLLPNRTHYMCLM